MTLPDLPPPRRINNRLGPFRYMTWRQFSWMHFKLVFFVWALAMLLYTPSAVELSLKQPILSIWTGMTMVGALTSIIGLICSSYPTNTRQHALGVSIELLGWTGTTVGPFVYFTTQLGLLITNKEGLPGDLILHTRLALTIFAYGMLAALLTRGLILIRLWRKQAKRPEVPA